MSKHTPGPWTVKKAPKSSNFAGYGFHITALRKDYEGREYLATVAKTGGLPNDRDSEIETQANAALIAAAPDMYEALKALRDEINEMKYGKPFAGRPHAKMDAADAALAKAEGRS